MVTPPDDRHITLAVDRPHWHRQPNERRRQFSHFLSYLGLGPSLRSYARVYEMLENSGIKLSWGVFCTRGAYYKWVIRAEAWDDYMADLELQEYEAEAKRMAIRQARLGMSLQTKAAEALESLPAEEIRSGAQISSLAKTGVDIERLARGEATRRVDVRNLVYVLTQQLDLLPIPVAQAVVRILTEQPEDIGRALKLLGQGPEQSDE